MALVAELIAAGQPNRAVAEASDGMDRMSGQRHRTQHMMGKVGVVAQQRQAAERRHGGAGRFGGTVASAPEAGSRFLARRNGSPRLWVYQWELVSQ